MKLENKHFLFVLESKPGKNGKKSKLLPTFLSLFLAAVLISSSLLIYHAFGNRNTPGPHREAGLPLASREEAESSKESSKTGGTQEEEAVVAAGTYLSSEKLSEDIRSRYEASAAYTYGEAVRNVKREDTISLQAGFDVEELDFEYWTEIAALYKDPELKNAASVNYSYDKEKQVMVLSPGSYPDGKISVNGLPADMVRNYEHDDVSLFPKDTGAAWGNIGTMYLALYIDLKTGEKLDIPEVRIITVEGEIEEAPILTYGFTDDGRLELSWNEIGGAEEYIVCSVEYSDEKGINGSLKPIQVVSGTCWSSPSPAYGETVTNSTFKNYEICQDDWYNDWYKEERIEEFGEEPTARPYPSLYSEQYCVIAVSREGCSMMSNTVDITRLASSLPYTIAASTWQANGFSYEGYDSAEETFAYGYVTMCDGMTAKKLIHYETDRAVVVADRYITVDENGEYVEGNNVKVLKVPYIIEGTPFEDVLKIVNYEEANLNKDLAFLADREEKLRKKAGDVAIDNNVEFNEDELPGQDVRMVEDVRITANSALSEYLAANMLAGVSVIDLSAFREAADVNLVGDAFFEAYYQNPLILGVDGYKISKGGTAVKVLYDDDAAVTAQKQEQLQQKVAEIIGTIITSDMTELEKEMAINQYLCDTITYDEDALANAEQYDYEKTDEQFNDSFTAYGALINGKCVCAGYAGAFKLLADAAGLETVVVTGVLEGGLSHAWNKVRIDGDWQILDVTNNDMDFLSNALLNLPNEAGDRILEENKQYVMDACLKDYAAVNGQKEYYRVNRKYFPYDEIAYQLAQEIGANGCAVLRTEYDLDDEMFSQIGSALYDYVGEEQELFGCYWLGVIYIEAK